MTVRRTISRFLWILAVAAVFAGCSKENKISVMSFNIRVCPDETADGANNWQFRREAVTAMIMQTSPDLIGIQEGLYPQVNYMEDNLPGYVRFGVEREDAQERGEANAIFLKKDRFDILDKGTFWISETPDTVSLGWDAAYRRTVTWAKIRDRKGGREILFFNTHFDHVGDTARLEAGNLIERKLMELSEEGQPVFLTGDFNSNFDSKYLDPVRNYMQNARETALESCDWNTFNNWGTIAPDGEKKSVIDHIFYRNARALKYEVLTGGYGAEYISDHYPIVLTAEI